MKVIIIDTPRGQYSLPLKPVAENRADVYACEIDGHTKGDKDWQEEVDWVMEDSFEAIDWLLNNNDWDEWKHLATKINDKVNVTEADFWRCSDNFKITDIIELNINLKANSMETKIKMVEMTGSPKEFGFSTKEEFLCQLEPHGFAHSKMTKKNNQVNILVCGDMSSTSKKMTTAKELGVEIMTYGDLKDAYDLIGDLDV